MIDRHTLFRLLTVLAVPLLVLLVGELLLSAAGYRTTHQKEDPFLGFESVTTLFERTPDGTYETRDSRLEWFNHQEFEADKPEDGYRIFSFGGSTTFGRPYDHTTSFSNWLQVLLDASSPSTRHEVVNVGGVSYASYRVVNLMNEMVQYDPDLFVVFTGHNEFLEERTYSDLLEEPELVTRLRTLLHRSRTYTLVRDLWLGLREPGSGSSEAGDEEPGGRSGGAGAGTGPGERYRMAGEVTAILDQSFGLDRYQRDRELRSAILEHFRFNLGRMVDIARDEGVRLIFVVPPANEKDFSPFKSQVCESLSGKRLRAWHDLYELGGTGLDQQEYGRARKAFLKARELDSCHAGLRFGLGRALLGLGRHDAAKEQFIRARDLDVAPLRATSRIQETVREVGRGRDVPTIDLVELLEARTREQVGHDILGNEVLLDHVHPRISVHQQLAEELFRTVSERSWIEPERSLEQLETAALYDSVMASLDDSYHATRDLNLAKVLTWLGKTEEAAGFIDRAAEDLPEHPEAQYLQGTLHQHRGQLERAARAYRRAVRLDSTFARAYNSLGGVYERTGQLQRAITAIREALRYQPENDHAYFNLGNALRKAGRAREAIDAYREAVDLNPGHSQAWNNLAGVHITRESYDEAVEALERTLELDPQNVSAHKNLGVVHYRRGELDRARAMFEQVLEIRPGDTFARRWLEQLDREVGQ